MNGTSGKILFSCSELRCLYEANGARSIEYIREKLSQSGSTIRCKDPTYVGVQLCEICFEECHNRLREDRNRQAENLYLGPWEVARGNIDSMKRWLTEPILMIASQAQLTSSKVFMRSVP